MASKSRGLVLIVLAIYGQQGIKNCPLDSCNSISKSISFMSNIRIFCQERYNWPFFYNDGRILTKSCVIRSEEDGSHGPLFTDWFEFLIKDLILLPVGQESGMPRRNCWSHHDGQRFTKALVREA